ncbi:two-component system sensor histidine kinase KdpD [Leeuwenhoekiella aestuarii]|uniref:histidine kinase n=1 Tax=Leeuwenhoekiella aestuarii TaxID=2249426 RepID=A0A4Q0P0N7_9FLAO|nr:ATP-binding protein [Leeuwenhoekiella aestuarii]RXG18368.1 two-component system sensor histidine kinase KdpD [Leeuwenhoekiella aestuarii]RXG19673.1 two-component system sensor histidine kinase KdpD [Leeuwenhoekiella aestuarii]
MPLTIYKRSNPYLISGLLIVAATLISQLSIHHIGYQGVALIYLLVVSISAMLFDIWPVLITALSSAVLLNFCFITPLYTFKIVSTEDVLMFFMYLILALVNAVLTYKIRDYNSKKRDEEEKTKTINLYNILLNSLSHELRTPIATIIGSIDTIQDQKAKLSETHKQELYDEISIAGSRLNRQVENLLNMSRLEAGILKPSFDWFDVNELIFNVLKQNQEHVANHQLVFTPQKNLDLVWTDGGFLETILQNLVYNALQHTPKQTTILIEARLKDQSLKISVSDNGNGFPKASIPVAFDKFYKLNNQATGGTGLGLSIAKGFTEALAGTISLENKKTGGALFNVCIPSKTLALKDFEHE